VLPITKSNKSWPSPNHQEWMHKATPPQSLGLCLILDVLA
jgi:hypothetical protein